MARSDITHLQPASPPSSMKEWFLAVLVVAAPVMTVNWLFSQPDTTVSGRIRVDSRSYYTGPLVEPRSLGPSRSASTGGLATGLSGGRADNLLLIPAPESSVSDNGGQPYFASASNGISSPTLTPADTPSESVRLLVHTPRSNLGPSLITLSQTSKPTTPATAHVEKDPFGRPADLVATTVANEATASARQDARRRRIVNAEPRDFLADPPYPIPDYTSLYRESRANIRRNSYALAPPKVDQRTADIMAGNSPLSGKTPDSPMDGWKSVGMDPWGRPPSDAAGTGADSSHERASVNTY